MNSIVFNQSIRHTVIQFAGVFVGIFSTLLIYPADLSLYGLYAFMTNTASLLVPFVSLGFGHVLLRYFPFYRDSNGVTSPRFLRNIYTFYAAGIVAFGFIFYFARNKLLGLFHDPEPLIIQHFIFILPITILYVLHELAVSFCTTHKEIAIPALLGNLIKIWLPISFMLCVRQWINASEFLMGIMLYYVCIILFLTYRLSLMDKPLASANDRFYPPVERREMLRFAAYSILTGTSAVLALRIDSLMISTQLNMSANGQFSLAYFMSNACFIPAMSLMEILSPFVSMDTFKSDLDQLRLTYRKSVEQMLIPTAWAAAVLYWGLNDLIHILPNGHKLSGIQDVLGLLLIARLADAVTGVNHHILNFSKHYRWELWLLLGLIILNLGFNIILIPKWGITGAAMGTCVSVCLFNIAKTTIIYFKTGLQPYSRSMLRLLSISAITIVSPVFLDFTGCGLMHLTATTICVSICMLYGIIYFNISDDFRNYLLKILPVSKK